VTSPQVSGAEGSCSYGCLDPNCDACVLAIDARRDGAIGRLATIAGTASRWARALERVAERLRP
jgi:hypothetical protein